MVFPGDIVTASNRGVYFVGGEVLRPGIYPMGGAVSIGTVTAASGEGMVKNMTLLQALAQAGGITAIAARSHLHILRTVDGKRVDIEVNQVKLSEGKVADPILQPNDIIYLPPSYWRQQTNNLFSTALSSLYAAASVRTANF
jgi:polysaccharide biosynthesis/export protein